MASPSGFLRRGIPPAAFLFALLDLVPLRADQTVQVGPGMVFSPSTVTVAPGEAVIWNFNEFHTSTSDVATGPEVWDSGFLSSGTFSHTFTTPGNYPYYCQVHSVPGGTAMNGVVIVSGAGTTATPSPTATVTPTLPPATPIASPTPTSPAPPASPTPTSPPPTAGPAPTAVPTAGPGSAAGIPTLDPAGAISFALILAAAGLAALLINRSR